MSFIEDVAYTELLSLHPVFSACATQAGPGFIAHPWGLIFSYFVCGLDWQGARNFPFLKSIS